MATILLVDDEEDVLRPLVFALERAGHRCNVCASGTSALQSMREGLPDLLVLDLMLPDISGTEICRRVRANPDTASLPVIIVSARGDEFDRVVGFEIGADDYVTKPFSVREFALRVSALLRRTAVSPSEQPILEFGPLRLNREAHSATLDHEPLALTALEFRLLSAFLSHPGRALSRAALRDSAWGADYRITNRAVDTYVRRLRQKLGDAGEPLETVRGVGYRWGAADS